MDQTLLHPQIYLGEVSCRYLSFSLVSDEDQKVVQDYGVWGLKKFMGREYMGITRTTFIIDQNGIIEEVIIKVDTKNHTSQILT